MHEDLAKYCPNCPKRTNRRGLEVSIQMDVIRDNYSGCGVDYCKCPQCNQIFQVTYKIDEIRALDEYESSLI